MTSPIKPIHPDTIAFEKLFVEMAMGERFTWEQLADHVRKNLADDSEAVKRHARSAANRLQAQHGMVFDAYYDSATGERGMQRLDDAAIVKSSENRLALHRRAIRRVERRAALARHDSLDAEQQLAQATTLLASRGASRFLSRPGQETMAKLIASSGKIPELDAAWRALKG